MRTGIIIATVGLAINLASSTLSFRLLGLGLSMTGTYILSKRKR